MFRKIQWWCTTCKYKFYAYSSPISILTPIIVTADIRYIRICGGDNVKFGKLLSHFLSNGFRHRLQHLLSQIGDVVRFKSFLPFSRNVCELMWWTTFCQSNHLTCKKTRWDMIFLLFSGMKKKKHSLRNESHGKLNSPPLFLLLLPLKVP